MGTRHRAGGITRTGVESDNDTGSEESDEEEIESDIDMLRDYKFITATSTNLIEMHRLVQFAARAWLDSHSLYQKWAQKSIQLLDDALPNGEYKNWNRCQVLFPHARPVLDLKLKGDDALVHRASILHKAAAFMWLSGQLLEAEDLTGRCVL